MAHILFILPGWQPGLDSRDKGECLPGSRPVNSPLATSTFQYYYLWLSVRSAPGCIAHLTHSDGQFVFTFCVLVLAMLQMILADFNITFYAYFRCWTFWRQQLVKMKVKLVFHVWKYVYSFTLAQDTCGSVSVQNVGVIVVLSVDCEEARWRIELQLHHYIAVVISEWVTQSFARHHTYFIHQPTPERPLYVQLSIRRHYTQWRIQGARGHAPKLMTNL